VSPGESLPERWPVDISAAGARASTRGRRMRMFAISYMKEQIVRRSPMAYTIDEFCAESRALLKAQPLMDALAQMSKRL
jgi:hypothetical protein